MNSIGWIMGSSPSVAPAQNGLRIADPPSLRFGAASCGLGAGFLRLWRGLEGKGADGGWRMEDGWSQANRWFVGVFIGREVKLTESR
jgi:hypothetical protein